MRIHLVAVGQLKSGPEFDLVQTYRKRLRWSFDIHEVVCKKKPFRPLFKRS